jgi:hypothetical protein
LQSLGVVTWFTDRLQVVIVIRAAHCLVDNVVDLGGQGYVPMQQTGLAQAVIAFKDLLALSIPG